MYLRLQTLFYKMILFIILLNLIHMLLSIFKGVKINEKDKIKIKEKRYWTSVLTFL